LRQIGQRNRLPATPASLGPSFGPALLMTWEQDWDFAAATGSLPPPAWMKPLAYRAADVVLRELLPGALEELLRRSVFDEFAHVEEDHPVGQPACLP